MKRLQVEELKLQLQRDKLHFEAKQLANWEQQWQHEQEEKVQTEKEHQHELEMEKMLQLHPDTGGGGRPQIPGFSDCILSKLLPSLTIGGG